MKDIVYDICERMLSNSPERSYKRLNPALRSTLSNCIEADLPFLLDTFQRIYDELRGGWWFGDGAGSHVGEHFYTLACKVNHASAQQSFEAFAQRPACLWEEDAKTPVRLHVGAEFTWKGHRVTVTSMRNGGLVACTYNRCATRAEGLNAGASFYVGSYFTILTKKGDRKGYTLRVAPSKKNESSRVTDRRFSIPYSDISDLRRTAKARTKAIIEQIKEADDVDAVKAVCLAINNEHFRHFELEEINAAFLERAKGFANQDKIAAWRSGANGAWLGTDEILLRVNGDHVQCSNGNSIKKATAIHVLPIILEHRKKPVTLDVPLEGFRIQRVDSKGVQVGCTLVPWKEIDHLAHILNVA